jgi:acyl carrier protein
VNETELRSIVLDVLSGIAPELDPATLRANVSFRDQLDIDSMDFLNFAVGLHERLGVEIPEADYRQLETLDAAAEYLAARV